jgi:hypothetical protein
MPRVRREAPIVVEIRGRRAASLADRLLSPEERLERAWARLARHAPRASRVSHDWDPATGRLVIAAQPRSAPG